MTESRRFTITLSPEEWHERSQELAERVEDYKEIDGERKEAASSYREQLKAIRTRIEQLSSAVATNHEQRDVVCRWMRDQDLNCMKLVREDTGEGIEVRPFSDEEKQEVLFKGGRN